MSTLNENLAILLEKMMDTKTKLTCVKTELDKAHTKEHNIFALCVKQRKDAINFLLQHHNGEKKIDGITREYYATVVDGSIVPATIFSVETLKPDSKNFRCPYDEIRQKAYGFLSQTHNGNELNNDKKIHEHHITIMKKTDEEIRIACMQYNNARDAYNVAQITYMRAFYSMPQEWHNSQCDDPDRLHSNTDQ